jgi:hypothetical protein
MKIRLGLVATTMLCAAYAVPALADDRSLQAEIAALKAQLQAQAAQIDRLERLAQATSRSEAATSAKLETLAAAPASVASSPATEVADTSAPKTTIGGYGEVNFNGYLKDRSRNQADLRRVVLYVGHRFNDKLSLITETEFEHAVTSGDGDPGEVAIEQAYINYAFNPALNVKAGLFLMPFGFINRNHEPTAFNGVERNEVETRIIPSTLREGGVGIYGTTAFGLYYDVGITTNYTVDKFDDPSSPLASIHQELAEAKAADASIYGALEYRGVPGLVIGGGISSGNSTQSNAAFRQDPNAPDLGGIKGRITLFDVHGRYQIRGFDIKALYARGSISGAGRINQAFAAANLRDGGDRPIVPSAFDGWLVEGAYDFGLGGDAKLTPFARYEKFNTQAKLARGLVADPANRDKVFTTGLSFKPLPEIVFKVDYQKFIDNSANDRINLGIGYNF